MNQRSTQELYDSMKLIVQDQLKGNNLSLLNSAVDQEIVVFLGVTGAGKSTLINILNDKVMIIDENEEFAIQDPNEPDIMIVGMTGKSETLLPKWVKVGKFIFYDLPGFNDNRGAAINLVNASYIKHIMESAKSVRMVFVAGQDEITASRGDSFKKLLKITEVLVPKSMAIKNSSLLVVTKSRSSTSDQLLKFLKTKIDDTEEVESWLNEDKTLPVSRRVDQEQKAKILEKIIKLTPSKIDKVNIEAIYSTDVRNDLRLIYQLEMDASFEKVFGQYKIAESTLEGIKQSTEYYLNSFEKDLIVDIQNSTIIKLMKPIVEKIFDEEEEKFVKLAKGKIYVTLSQLEAQRAKLEMKQVEVQAEERELRDKKIINDSVVEQEKLMQTNKEMLDKGIIQKQEFDDQELKSQIIIQQGKKDYQDLMDSNKNEAEQMTRAAIDADQKHRESLAKYDLMSQGLKAANDVYQGQMKDRENKAKENDKQMDDLKAIMVTLAARQPEVRYIERDQPKCTIQ